ncbi:MAG: hypothetical protein FWF52_00815 [Candidatus Azobacteroides sp.]|nr:hypothetical protein [Candidatus Azobacteroides sp.]
MNKTISYIVAILACVAYIFLLNLIVVLLGFKLGGFGYIIFMCMPCVGLWKLITGLAEEREEKDTEK